MSSPLVPHHGTGLGRGGHEPSLRVLVTPSAFHALQWFVAIPPGFRKLTEASGFAAANGPWFEKIDGPRAIRGFMPGPQHANALGIVHGGMLAAFLDSAMGTAVLHTLDRRAVTVRLSLDWERTVTDQIYALVEIATAERNHIALRFLDWFVNEQREEVNLMSTLLGVVERAGESNLLYVEDYLARHGIQADAPAEG